MQPDKETVTVRVNLEILPEAIQALVANGKKLTGKNEKGHYAVDTADLLNIMISQFLLDKDFVAWAGDIENYPEIM
jgi:hypothetical protein